MGANMSEEPNCKRWFLEYMRLPTNSDQGYSDHTIRSVSTFNFRNCEFIFQDLSSTL